MSISPGEVCALAVLGGILAFDESASPSLLVSQPLFAAGLAGAILGHFEAALVAGVLVQMLFVAGSPVGGAMLPDAMLGGLAAAICVPPDVRLADPAWLDDVRLAAPLAVGVGAAYFGRLGLGLQRRVQARLAASLPQLLEAGDASGIERLHRSAMALHLGRGAVCAVVVALASPPLARGLAAIGVAAPAGRLALALAALSLAQAAGGRRRVLAFAAGVLAGAVVVLR